MSEKAGPVPLSPPSVCEKSKQHSRTIILGREDIGQRGHWHTESIATVLLGPSRASGNQTSPKNVVIKFPLKLAKGMVIKVHVWPPPIMVVRLFSEATKSIAATTSICL